jgi:NTE family protein
MSGVTRAAISCAIPADARFGRSRRLRTAFVLSGGASLGALQVGMLRALYERGIVPDVLVGASAGALNAAFVASRPQSVETADELATVWRNLRREDVFPFRWRALVRGLAGSHDHLVGDGGLRELARRHLRIERLEQAVVPLHLVTFDLVSGEELRLSSGPATEAVLAAAAIPGLLPSVRWGDRRLVDGGVVNNTPISHAIELGAERVYVLPTADASRALEKLPRGAFDAAIHGITLLIDSQIRADVARYAGKIELLVLPAPNPYRVQPTDFRHASSLIEGALAATRHFLADATVTDRGPTLTPYDARTSDAHRVTRGMEGFSMWTT